MNLYKYFTTFSFIDRIGIAAIFLMYAIFSTTLSLGKSVVQYGPIVTYISLRMFISGIILLFYYYFFLNKKIIIKKGSDFLGFMNIALFGIAASYILCFWALPHLSIAKSAFFLVLNPFFTAFFAWIHGFESFTYKKIIGLIIGALGTIPILMSNTADEAAFSSFLSLNLPEFLSLVSVALYAYSWIEFKRLMNKGYDNSLINGMTMFLGGIAMLGVSYIIDGWYLGNNPITDLLPYSFYVMTIVAIGTFCFSLYGHILKKYPPTLIAFFGFSEPFFAALFGWFFLHESISWLFVAALSIVSLGLYLFYQEEF